MEIIPAIDLVGGRCVRLVQGRFDRVIAYDRDPVEVAERFLADGATRLHVIDLDGARDGAPANFESLRRIVATGARVEFGGGLREERDIDAALELGVDRAIVGTRAAQDLDWFRRLVHEEKHAGRISLGLDARLGRLASHGWTRETPHSAAEICARVSDWPLATIHYTDIGRDGTLLGPNIESIRSIASASIVPIIACGGVTDVDDVRHLARVGVLGVVIGRAIYEGQLTLADALEAAGGG